MKKYCLVTILLSVLMSMPVSAYDFEKNGIYYNIEGDHVSVTYSGNGVYTGSVSIPSQVTYDGVTYPVTAIGEWAFEGGEGMTYLSIPSSITSIGEYAFIDCGSNINVYINDLKAWCKVTFGNEHSTSHGHLGYSSRHTQVPATVTVIDGNPKFHKLYQMYKLVA